MNIVLSQVRIASDGSLITQIIDKVSVEPEALVVFNNDEYIVQYTVKDQTFTVVFDDSGLIHHVNRIGDLNERLTTTMCVPSTFQLITLATVTVTQGVARAYTLVKPENAPQYMLDEVHENAVFAYAVDYGSHTKLFYVIPFE